MKLPSLSQNIGPSDYLLSIVNMSVSSSRKRFVQTTLPEIKAGNWQEVFWKSGEEHANSQCFSAATSGLV